MNGPELNLPKLDERIDVSLALFDALSRSGIRKEHCSANYQYVKMIAGDIIHKNNENPDIWSDEKTILFMSAVDGFVSSAGRSRYPFEFFLDEIGIGSFETPVSGREIEDQGLLNEIQRNPKLSKFHCDLRSRKLSEEYFDNWRDGSPLSKTRQKFGVSKEEEKPYVVCKTKLPIEEFAREFHAAAFVTRSKSGSVMVFPLNPDENHVHHEYVHTQWFDLAGGKRYFSLFRGLTEAFVERNTPIPSTYSAQRDLLAEFEYYIPNIAELIMKAGKYPNSRGELLRSIMDTFGLSGVQIAARYSPVEGNHASRFFTREQNLIFLPVSEAKKELQVLQ